MNNLEIHELSNRMPLALLIHVFDELEEVNRIFYFKDFSQEYLGRCSSYFSYLHSTGRQPSADVLLNLWSHLNAQRIKFIHDLSDAQNERERQIIGNSVDVYTRLCGEVFEALQERGSQ